jgi:hypothetical protein
MRPEYHSRTPPEYLPNGARTPIPPVTKPFLHHFHHGARIQDSVAKHLRQIEGEASEQSKLPGQGGAVNRC